MIRKTIEISALIIIIFSQLCLASAEKDNKPIVIKELSWGRCYLGKTALKVEIKNESDKDKTLLAELLVKDSAGEGERYTSLVKLEGREKRGIKMVYGIKDEGEYDLSLSIIDPGSKQIYYTSSSSCSIPRNKRRVKSLLKDIIKIKFSLLSLKGERGLSEDADKAFKRLVSIKEKVDKRMGKKDWMKCAQDLKTIESKVNLLKEEVNKKKIPVYPYVVTLENNLTKVFKDDLLAGKITKEVKISAAKNEYEGFQVILIPLARELKKVEVEVSDLIGKRASIKKENIKLNLVGYVKTRPPIYPVERVGWFPDPLMDFQLFNLGQDEVQPLWITIYIPEDTLAGDYEGYLSIRPKDLGETKIKINLHVFNFCLPKKFHLKTAFAFSEGQVANFYGMKELSSELKRRYYTFLLEHRLNPSNIYLERPQPQKGDLQFCIERGLNAFHIGHYTDRCPFKSEEERKKYKSSLKRFLKDYIPSLKEKGWEDFAYIYGFDEPSFWERYDESKKKIRDVFGLVKEVAPGTRRVCTVVPDPDIFGYIDIWCPLTSNFDKHQEICKERQRAGDEVWWYVCCGPLHPYANFFIDYPAIDHRILFWMSYKYEISGFLYYNINRWVTNYVVIDKAREDAIPQETDVQEGIKKGKRWPEIPWNTFTYSYFNGDGHLIYPGPDKEPLSSIRLENIRDGIEDYEYLCILKQKLENLKKANKKKYQKIKERVEKVLKVPDALVKDLKDYSKDPEELYNLRNEVASLIEE